MPPPYQPPKCTWLIRWDRDWQQCLSCHCQNTLILFIDQILLPDPGELVSLCRHHTARLFLGRFQTPRARRLRSVSTHYVITLNYVDWSKCRCMNLWRRLLHRFRQKSQKKSSRPPRSPNIWFFMNNCTPRTSFWMILPYCGWSLHHPPTPASVQRPNRDWAKKQINFWFHCGPRKAKRPPCATFTTYHKNSNYVLQ